MCLSDTFHHISFRIKMRDIPVNDEEMNLRPSITRGIGLRGSKVKSKQRHVYSDPLKGLTDTILIRVVGHLYDFTEGRLGINKWGVRGKWRL